MKINKLIRSKIAISFSVVLIIVSCLYIYYMSPQKKNILNLCQSITIGENYDQVKKKADKYGFQERGKPIILDNSLYQYNYMVMGLSVESTIVCSIIVDEKFKIMDVKLIEPK